MLIPATAEDKPPLAIRYLRRVASGRRSAIAVARAVRSGNFPETLRDISLELARMVETKAWGQAMGYSLGSVIAGVCAVFLGMFLMRKLLA